MQYLDRATEDTIERMGFSFFKNVAVREPWVGIAKVGEGALLESVAVKTNPWKPSTLHINIEIPKYIENIDEYRIGRVHCFLL